MECKIYKINFENNKSYIGITSETVHRRIKKHIAHAKRKPQYLVHYALNKYEHNIEVLDTVEDIYLALLLEQCYIEEYKTYKPGGYNMTLGGDLPPRKKNQNQINASIKTANNILRYSRNIPVSCSNGKVYDSIAKAARQLNLNQTCVHRVLKGGQKQTKGFIFQYLKERT